jgi:hypothetical protein
MECKKALESVNFSLRKVQSSIFDLDRKIKGAEEMIENAKTLKTLEVNEMAAIAICNALAGKTSKFKGSRIIPMMDQQIKSAHALILATEREKAILLPKEKHLANQKALMEGEILKRVNRVRKHKEEKMRIENAEKKVISKPAANHKKYDDVVRHLRLLRDRKVFSEFLFVKEDLTLTSEQVAKELECVNELIEQNNEWFKVHPRDHIDFKSKLVEAEYIHDCKKKLEAIKH